MLWFPTLAVLEKTILMVPMTSISSVSLGLYGGSRTQGRGGNSMYFKGKKDNNNTDEGL